MKKSSFSVLLLAGVLMLAGAGCSFTGSTTEQTNPPSNNTVQTTTDTAQVPSDAGVETTSGDFPIAAELMDTKTVKLTWVKPTDMAEGSTIRLMHSSSDNPSFPAADNNHQPYWYQPSSTQTELEWSNIPAGTRYFRACEYKDNKCLRFSNTIKLQVK